MKTDIRKMNGATLSMQARNPGLPNKYRQFCQFPLFRSLRTADTPIKIIKMAVYVCIATENKDILDLMI